MNDSDLSELCPLFLALSDSTRLKLIRLMADGEVSVGYLAESIGESQPKVSRHLAYLRTAGLVATRREGKHIFYGIEWPLESVAANVITAVVGERSRKLIGNSLDGDNETSMPDSSFHDISDGTYLNDYVQQEIEIYLL